MSDELFPKAIVDGMPTSVTWRRLQLFLRAWGYEGPIDGKPNRDTWCAMQRFANSIDPEAVS